MAQIIIFGIKDLAELAHYYLEKDSKHDVIAFSVNKQYMDREVFQGLPVVPFEDIQTLYPPSDFKFFAPMTGAKMNKTREKIYYEIKNKNYKFITYISSKATIFDKSKIGENCFILEDNTIQPFTTIGNNVMMWSGNHIGHHGIINDHVFFTSHVVLSGNCIVEPYCFFGVNSTIRDGIKIAEASFISMAAAITKDTDAYGVYKGNPAIKNNISSLKLRF